MQFDTALIQSPPRKLRVANVDEQNKFTSSQPD